MIDLHIHSYYSDGRHSPAEIVNYASKIGLEAIAITDHDTIRGNIEAAPFAEKLGLELISAVEMTTHWDSLDNIDLLAYFVDFEHLGFQTMIDDAIQDLQNRITDCCENLTHEGYPISYADVQEQNSRYAGGSQLIYALIKKNLVPDYATGRSLLNKAWEEARPCQLQMEDAIAKIRDAGGVAVLAHPTMFPDNWLTADRIKYLAEIGLAGIEVYHPVVKDDARAYFMRLAEELGLAISGGSDEHGFPEGFTWLGKQPVSYAILERLRQKKSI